ncbi:MAG: hypothetical protein AAF449_09925 [Myxococcota bacterium]
MAKARIDMLERPNPPPPATSLETTSGTELPADGGSEPPPPRKAHTGEPTTPLTTTEAFEQLGGESALERYKTTAADLCREHDIYDDTLATEVDLLLPMADITKRRGFSTKLINQPYAYDLDEVFEDAKRVLPSFTELIRSIADQTTGTPHVAPLKSKKRAHMKGVFKYGDGTGTAWHRLTDIVRATLAYESNGYWARNYDQGVRLIEQIPMDDYLLSTSTFHVEYVPMKAVENVWRAATDAGRRVMIRITQSVPPSEHDLKLLEEVRAVIPDKYIKIEQAAAAGRAVETGVAPALQQFDATDDRCPADGPLVDDRGLVHPCCNALSIVEDHALEMGRMGQDSPDVILERLATDALFTSLREEGIAKVAARATGPDNPTPRLRGDACNRCYNLFADLNLRAGLKTLR